MTARLMLIFILFVFGGCSESAEREMIHEIGESIVKGVYPDQIYLTDGSLRPKIDEFVSKHPDIEVDVQFGDISTDGMPEDMRKGFSRRATHRLILRSQADGEEIYLTARLTYDEASDRFDMLETIMVTRTQHLPVRK